MTQSAPYVSLLSKRLGWAGLLPQLLAVVMIASRDPAWYFAALAFAACYAALILSFLGGVWWGLALTSPTAPRWAPIAAVVPTLIALGAFLPWMFGLPWPGPSLIIVGASLTASPWVDRALSRGETDAAEWLALRMRLSTGLGLLTIIAAWL